MGLERHPDRRVYVPVIETLRPEDGYRLANDLFLSDLGWHYDL